MDRFPPDATQPTERYLPQCRDAELSRDQIERMLLAEHPESTSRSRSANGLERALEQISDAAADFCLQLDMDSLLLALAQHARKLLDVEVVIVHAHRENQLQPATISCGDDTVPASQWAPSSAVGGLPMDVPTAASREAVSWCSRHARPRRFSLQPEHHAAFHDGMCVPLTGTQNRVLSVLEFRTRRNGAAFGESDLRWALCLARVATSAVDRARLFDRVSEWTRSMETLLSFNATVNQQLDPPVMVRRLVANVTGFLDAAGGAAGIVVGSGTEQELVCDGCFFDGQWHAHERIWKPGEGIPGTVLQTEFPLLINDYATNELADPTLVRQFNVASCICVPIKNAQEQVLGFFKLHRRAGEPEFTWQDAAFLESLGNTAAVAIENARLVRSLEDKNRQVKNLSKSHLLRLEQERQHIARELHDETGQMLIGLKLRLQVLAGMLNRDQQDAKQELALLRRHVNEATASLKDLAKRLRPPTLDELGFEATVRQLVAEYRRQVPFQLDVEFVSPAHLSDQAETALYRVVQESLTNVAKHARASQATVQFERVGEQQILTIVDDGQGFNVLDRESGLGLVGIRERVKMLGGECLIESRPGRTEIRVALPGEPPHV